MRGLATSSYYSLIRRFEIPADGSGKKKEKGKEGKIRFAAAPGKAAANRINGNQKLYDMPMPPKKLTSAASSGRTSLSMVSVYPISALKETASI